MPDNLGLLLPAVAIERPSGFDRIVITAERVPPQHEIYASLVLPDVNQLVDQMPLPPDRTAGEAVAIAVAFRMKMYVAAWGHRHIARLEEGPFAPNDPHRRIIYGGAENALSQRDLGLG